MLHYHVGFLISNEWLVQENIENISYNSSAIQRLERFQLVDDKQSVILSDGGWISK